MPFEFIDDVAIADVEFRAWGEDLPEVFVAAAGATMNVMVQDLDTIEQRDRRRIVLENDDLDMLLFDFLQELIYFKDAEHLLLRVSEVKIDQDDSRFYLHAEAAGEPLDPKRHEQGADVKAVTLHRFSLEQDENGWTANVILDI